jgi:glycosyltransferase involved in cell wall biosynthesis
VQQRHIEMPGDRFDAWSRLRLPLAAWRDGAEVLHCPANECPSWLPIPTVVTIHDLIPLDMPAGRSAADVRRFEQSITNAIHKTNWIICPSQYTRARLVDDFGANGERITVNAWAPDSAMELVPAARAQAAAEHYDVTRPFVLHFGATAPRKNTRRVLQAWADLPAVLRQQWQLLVVGLDVPALAAMRELAERMKVTDSVRLHTFAPESHVAALLSAATILAYPSLSEGFGLPILDAWVAHTAVLTSDATSLPEVAGNAALLVEPTDAGAIRDGLRRLMLDEPLRGRLIASGLARLPQYTWSNTVSRFANVLQRAIGFSPARAAA